MDRIREGQFAGRTALPTELRIVSWNIERGSRLREAANFVDQVRADVCLFQEVDLNARRTGRIDVAQTLARELKLNYAFAPAFRELTQGDGALHGQATLSRLPLERTRRIKFRYQSSFWKPRWWVPDKPPFQEREGGRIALVSEIPFGRGALVTYNLHLESRGPEKLRALQLEEVIQDANKYSRNSPIVIAGDLNTKRRWSPCIDLLQKAGFQDVIGDPSRFTTSRGGAFAKLFIDGALDWIWIRGAVRAKDAHLHNDIYASDHFPLTVVLEAA